MDLIWIYSKQLDGVTDNFLYKSGQIDVTFLLVVESNNVIFTLDKKTVPISVNS